MRWFKKIVRAILALIPVFSFVFLSPSTSALSHEYLGYNFIPYEIPCLTLVDGHYETNWTVDNGCSTFYGSGFYINFVGDSYTSYEEDLQINHNFSAFVTSLSDNSCQYNGISPIFQRTLNHNSNGTDWLEFKNYSGMGTFSLNHPNWTPSTLDSNANVIKCHNQGKFGEDHNSPLNNNSLPSVGLMSCVFNDNGCSTYGGLVSVRSYIEDNILPYPYSSHSFVTKSHATDSNGIRYSHALSFSDIFNKPIHRFHQLTLNLLDTDGYFLIPSNISNGKQFEFKGTFEFDGSFHWHENIDSDGSYFRIHTQGRRYSGNHSWVDKYYDCTTNLVALASTTQLQFSCPFTLDLDYASINVLQLQILGASGYVWDTDSNWRFYNQVMITDGDDTPGDKWNTRNDGGGYIVGDARNDFLGDTNSWDIVIDGANFSQSLINLFGFSLINPFAPLLNLFSDQSSCASIPTIASMIHSEETTVCPWFNSTVRNITTPVLSISSMMLVFGFAVHWLGARSGNMFEDSVSTDNYSFHNKFSKGGKK